MTYVTGCHMCIHDRPLKDGWQHCCDAYPDGAPPKAKIGCEPGGICNNGIGFEESHLYSKYNITVAALRGTEPVNCISCAEGHYITDSNDRSTARSFYCNKCGEKINIDSVINIMDL